MAGMSSLTGTISTEFKWTAQNNLTGSAYNPLQNAGDIRKNYGLGTSLANGASGGADEIFSFQQTIAGGGTATLDLTAMTNILQQTLVNIVRIKGYQIRLLSSTDDSTITTPAAASVTVTNFGVAVPNPLDFASGGSGLTLALTTSGGAITSVAIGVAGSGYPPSTTFLVAPNQASGSGGAVSVITNGSGVPSTVALISGSGGAGYSNATVATTELGKYTIANGGAHMYFDVSGGGFAAVSATSKNLKFFNNDAANTATLEISFFGATT